MFTALSGLNHTVRFVIELAALVALGLWGWRSGGPAAGVALPLAAAVLWGLLAAPHATLDAPAIARMATQVLVLGGGAVALGAASTPAAGLTFAALLAVNTALLAVLPSPSWT